MIETIREQRLIEKLNRYLDINNENVQAIIELIKFNMLSTNKTKVKIELKDYISFIQMLNNALDKIDRDERYNFSLSIKEELEEFGLEVRVCTSCLKIMIEGYVIEDGFAYYCSDKCLEYDMTLEEFKQAYGDGNTETYWTEWF